MTLASGIVEDERQEIEINDGAQAVRKNRGTARADRACWAMASLTSRQGFQLTPGSVRAGGGKRHFRRGDDGIRHRKQDNTRVGEGST